MRNLISSNGSYACMVNAEIAAVLAVMRQNARWAALYIGGNDELDQSLVQPLKSLRRSIFTWQQPWNQISPSLYLLPFLEVVRSDETAASITGFALSAICKFMSIDMFDSRTPHADEAMHEIVESVTGCRFEVTDSASEEVVLMKILQVFVALMKHPASALLSDKDVCLVVNTCFHVVHQALTKGELLQRTARNSAQDIVRSIFMRLPSLDSNLSGRADSSHMVEFEQGGGKTCNDHGCTTHIYEESYGVLGIVEIFESLCSLLNTRDSGKVLGQNSSTIDEDVPLFALGLVHSAIELGGSAFASHPELMTIIQDDLFHFLIQLGVANVSPFILSMVCSIVLSLYHHLKMHLKIQLEAFFSCVILRLLQGKVGTIYQQEVAMEALVDFCRQPGFFEDIYYNFDCDMTCDNIFDNIGNSLSKSAYPAISALSDMNILALEGLIAILDDMGKKASFSIKQCTPDQSPVQSEVQGYVPFWTLKCTNVEESKVWAKFLWQQKYIKRRLLMGTDHFNRDPKKGLEFLQEIQLLPKELDPRSVACFFRYTMGLDKNMVGDFLGSHDDFYVQVLSEYTKTFDFEGMSLDMAMRFFLESFRLPGEAQKIHRVLEAFAGRYFEQCPHTFVDKDAAFLLAYSLIMLNTDQHNSQVKKKMTEEDFIRNNRSINGGQDLPREFLSKLYRSIAESEIRTSYANTELGEMSSSRWIGLMQKSKTTCSFILCDEKSSLDLDTFEIISGPSMAAISMVFDLSEDEEVLRMCAEGFLAIAKISSSQGLESILDDLVVSLCKFTTLLNPTAMGEPIIVFGDDIKACTAATTVFCIANKFGDHMRTSWRNILDCILRLHKLGLLPACVTNDPSDCSAVMDRTASGCQPVLGVQSPSARKRLQGLMGRFSQLLSLEAEESRPKMTQQQLAAHQRALQIVESCQIDNIIKDSKFLQGDSLLHLVRTIVWAAGKPKKAGVSPENEDTAIFCLDLLIAIVLNNRDRIMLVWQVVFEHIAIIIQTISVPCCLIEKTVFGLLHVCQRLLSCKEDLADEFLRSLQLILKLDANIADVFCERITREVMQLVKSNATQIRSAMGWRTVVSLLSITARHLEASEVGFEALSFVMAHGAYLTPANYGVCLDAAHAFAEVSISGNERSLRALDLMVESVTCLVQWSNMLAHGELEVEALKSSQDLGEMWVRLSQGLRSICTDPREEVRNYAALLLQRSLSAAEELHLPPSIWGKCFDQVIFVMLDDLLDVALVHSPKEYPNMEATLHHALKSLSKVFLQYLDVLYLLPNFQALWLSVLSKINRYAKAKLRGKGREKILEVVPELLKNMLLIMTAKGVLVPRSSLGHDSLWELTWLHVQDVCPFLVEELLPRLEANKTQETNYMKGLET